MPRVRRAAQPLPASALLQLMWLASPALPVGGFSYSEGLEAAIDAGLVSDEASAGLWLGDQLGLSLQRAELPLLASATLNSFPGEQVSIFALEPAVAIISQNLKYPLNRTRPSRWWQATLNESTSEKFTLTFIGGAVIVFQCYKDTAERTP